MSLRDRLRHNLSLKLVSLIIALVIWGTVHNQADPLVTRQQTVSVTATSVPENLAVANLDPAQITATVYGRRSALDRLEYSEFGLAADVRKGEIGTVSVLVEPHNLPVGVEIRHLSARMVKVSLDAVISVVRPIFAQARGEPAQSFMVAGTQIRPSEATVRGPSTEVRKVARLLAPLDVSGRNQTASITVDLMPLDAASLLVSGVKVDPAQAVVTVQMRQVNSKTVPVVPVISKVPAGLEVASVSVRPVVVTLTGKAEVLGATDSVPTASLDLTAEPGRAQYNVPLRTPTGATVLGSATARVTVTLRQASGRRSGAAETTPAAPAPSAPPESATPPRPKAPPADGGAGAGEAPPDQDKPPAPPRKPPATGTAPPTGGKPGAAAGSRSGTASAPGGSR